MYQHRISGRDFLFNRTGLNERKRLCLKSLTRTWIESVQGAVATWSNRESQGLLGNIAYGSVTRSLPLPVLTRSKNALQLGESQRKRHTASVDL
jgi:hypothetical protein